MIKQVSFVDYTYVRQLVPDTTIDERYIDPEIIPAQLLYIREKLGKTLYNTLINEWDNQSFTGLNKTLIEDYIQPALGWLVLYSALPSIRANITSNGIQSLTIQYGQPSSGDDIGALRNSLYEKGNTYLNLMREYISDNSSSFTNY